MLDDSLHNHIFRALKAIAKNESLTNNNIKGCILPATVESFDGTFVIVNIEVSSQNNYPKLTVPVLRSEYIRLPIQKGCRGILIPVSVNIEHITGLGQTAPTMYAGFNLSSMAFLPIASVTQPKVKSNDTLILYGEKDGVKIQTKDGSVFIHLSQKTVKIEADSIELNGKVTVKDDLTVNGNVDIKGSLTIGGLEFKAHTHTNGNQGSPTGGVMG